jgi:thiamine-phosphate pyrophosphorylase
VIGIGGIKRGQIPEVMATGAHGIGVITAISAAPDPIQATRELLDSFPVRSA